MLKHVVQAAITGILDQPPSGGCVLKRLLLPAVLQPRIQPPSGGCVLKPFKGGCLECLNQPSRLRAAVC